MNPSLFPIEPPMTCLGLDVQTPDPIGVPISAFIILKHIESGEVCHTLLCTEDCTDIEVRGMISFAWDRWREIMNNTRENDAED